MGMIGNTLALGLVSGANIEDGTVDTPDIKDEAVTASKLGTDVNSTLTGLQSQVTAIPNPVAMALVFGS